MKISDLPGVTNANLGMEASEPFVRAATTSNISGSSARLPTLLPAGFLNTNGNQIVDEGGNPVRIASIGWNQNFSDIPATVASMASAGFNTIRLDWVDATLFQANPVDSINLNTIKQIVSAAGAVGMRVIIDHHTDEAGTASDGYGAQQQNGLWYDTGAGTNNTNGAGVAGTVSAAQFQADWVTVAKTFAGNPTVIGYDLDNEPLMYGSAGATGVTWGQYTGTRTNNGVVGGPTDIHAMYQTVGNAVEAADPGALIIAEGPQNYGSNFAGTGTAPEGDLSVAAKDPVVLSAPNKVVYSVHEYPTEISNIPIDSGAAAMIRMSQACGYLESTNTAPVWIGEMGSSMVTSNSQAWATTLTTYMNGLAGSQGGPVFSGKQQPVSGDWWVWGYLPGEVPDGTLNANGSLNAAQQAVWSQLLPVSGSTIACFVSGTMIQTSDKPVPVEDLCVGDYVATADGSTKRIKWIGTKKYSKYDTKKNPMLLPITIKKNAIKSGIPFCDLELSSKHAISVENILIPIEFLVNGHSILRQTTSRSINYFHIELEIYDIIFANSSKVETYVNFENRHCFDGQTKNNTICRDKKNQEIRNSIMCSDNQLILAVYRKICNFNEIKHQNVSPLIFIDELDSSKIKGWAFDKNNCNIPVFVEAKIGDIQLGIAIAIAERPDVYHKEGGPVNCGFEISFSKSLPSELIQNVKVSIIEI